MPFTHLHDKIETALAHHEQDFSKHVERAIFGDQSARCALGEALGCNGLELSCKVSVSELRGLRFYKSAAMPQ